MKVEKTLLSRTIGWEIIFQEIIKPKYTPMYTPVYTSIHLVNTYLIKQFELKREI